MTAYEFDLQDAFDEARNNVRARISGEVALLNYMLILKVNAARVAVDEAFKTQLGLISPP